jgi:hypothetical protein
VKVFFIGFSINQNLHRKDAKNAKNAKKNKKEKEKEKEKVFFIIK